ncbi:amidohydrolase family protein [Oceaniglobus trochenteri]|uniref:amidohydrolase family protein n=1 Tax=Oceaniglobus trochenteri TaxID=2763260 RepID=UPI001CFF71B1|nr:amidohydrolase family protein [Oceaniglobus trochenteri]
MIDAHHHIWLQKDLPWLLGPEQPRIFGPYRAIMRDYTTREYLADIAGTGIGKSVYVQANWAPNWFMDEAAWVQEQGEEHGLPDAIVGYADFTTGDVRDQLDKLKKYNRMRGIRQQLHWHENPTYRFARDPDLCRDETVQKNIARLGDYGWSFDLQVFAPQMAGAVDLARACPHITFILQHAGMLEDLSDSGRKQWQDGMKALADCPNVVTKLSAFGTFIHRNDPDFIEEMIVTTEGIFGAERCMFGSNFPIEKLWTSYTELFNAFRSGAKSLSKKKQSAIFNDTAARVYGI